MNFDSPAEDRAITENRLLWEREQRRLARVARGGDPDSATSSEEQEDWDWD